jgi:threonyl-tRNA synthetase
LSPNQVSIIIISEKFILYAKEVFNLLKISDIRACIDDRNEKTGRKIRDAEIKKTPYMLIIGEKESTENKISVRKHGGENMGSMKIEKFIEIINKEIKNSINK